MELECGKPRTYQHDKALGKLHITQAILDSWGPGSWDKCVYWCAVQVKKFIRLSRIESIHLDLEFDEGDNEIVFELLSTDCKVHLTGYHDGNGNAGGDLETDTFYRWPQ
ncbi:hypothetical protein MKW94_028264 [Papaver nudicaule]|uniref:Nucleoplasmin-like domain-containing protein n=1 Tax=Papaver nudicaule TaxID=74823 RepID=A0AA41RTA8_PAPNU|nr:hypothetical protein [Papaver nudicaule]